MIRLNVFLNGDSKREQGKVILLDKTKATFEDFFNAVQEKFLSSSKFTRAFTEKGGEISSVDEMYHDDIIFVSDGENFKITNVTNFKRKQNFVPNSEEKEEENTVKKQKIQHSHVETSPLLLQVRVIDQEMETKAPKSKMIELNLHHRNGTIHHIKSLIRKNFDGLHENDQILIYKGAELEDTKRLHEYFGVGNKITDNAEIEKQTIFLMIKPITIFIKNKSGVKTMLQGIKHTLMVQELKDLLKNKKMLRESVFDLIFDGKILYDGHKLGEYGIFNGCILHCIEK